MHAIPTFENCPPAQDPEIDHVGPLWTVYQGSTGPYALHDHTGERPDTWDIFRAGLRHQYTILNCHCWLNQGKLFIVDDAGECRCTKHFAECLAIEEEPEDSC